MSQVLHNNILQQNETLNEKCNIQLPLLTPIQLGTQYNLQKHLITTISGVVMIWL